MPVCSYHNGKARSCKSEKIEQPASEFTSHCNNAQGSYIKIVKTCQTCRTFYKRQPKKIKPMSGFVHPSKMTFRMRQWVRNLTIRK